MMLGFAEMHVLAKHESDFAPPNPHLLRARVLMVQAEWLGYVFCDVLMGRYGCDGGTGPYPLACPHTSIPFSTQCRHFPPTLHRPLPSTVVHIRSPIRDSLISARTHSSPDALLTRVWMPPSAAASCSLPCTPLTACESLRSRLAALPLDDLSFLLAEHSAAPPGLLDVLREMDRQGSQFGNFLELRNGSHLGALFAEPWPMAGREMGALLPRDMVGDLFHEELLQWEEVPEPWEGCLGPDEPGRVLYVQPNPALLARDCRFRARRPHLMGEGIPLQRGNCGHDDRCRVGGTKVLALANRCEAQEAVASAAVLVEGLYSGQVHCYAP